jgi:uncharacterized protein (DUF2252 family)
VVNEEVLRTPSRIPIAGATETFDINDFNESCLAPVAFERVRFLTGVLVGEGSLSIGDKVTSKLVARFNEAYAANVISKKLHWVERPLATGPVEALLR